MRRLVPPQPPRATPLVPASRHASVSSPVSPRGQALRVAAQALTAHLRLLYKRLVRLETLLLSIRCMKTTRIVYYAMHHKPDQPYPLYSGAPFLTFWAAQLEAHKLARQGYSGWIMRIRETREEDWPHDQWLIDHSVEDAITRLAPF